MVLICSISFEDFAVVLADLMHVFQLMPYASAEDVVFKELGWNRVCNHSKIEI